MLQAGFKHTQFNPVIVIDKEEDPGLLAPRRHSEADHGLSAPGAWWYECMTACLTDESAGDNKNTVLCAYFRL